jgi:hypothetical protein
MPLATTAAWEVMAAADSQNAWAALMPSISSGEVSSLTSSTDRS